ncbi:MAG: flagellar protein FlaG [Rhodoferax sp.]|nr:flagellar protein FlaG [Rhodoferax sp.]MCF8209770.1 flagellar protein FlaG [Rhodoferax sp.]
MEIRSSSVVAGMGMPAQSVFNAQARPDSVLPVVPQAGAGFVAEPTQEALQQAVDHANQVLSSRVVDDLQFSIDEDTNIRVVKLIDRTSGDTVMQLPSVEMLRIAKSIDQFVGSLVQKTA